MVHPYPPRWAAFSYVGRHCYSLTFPTDRRRHFFVNEATVDRALTQILRASTQYEFSLITYCFMPDHLHLIVRGETDTSYCKAFIKAAKQYSAYYHSQAANGTRLWERYGEDRVIRDELELALTVRYVVANPVRAGLASHPKDYPFLGSQKYSVDELLQWCDYSDAIILD
jgi:putative transposase